MAIRRAGVEEELFVVDPFGRLSTLSDRVVRRSGGEDELDHELFLQQVEVQTAPHDDAGALREDLVAQRKAAVAAADEVGVRLAAMPVDVIGGTEPQPTPKHRYERIVDEFGEVARRSLICGMHVHVEVQDDEAVPVVDALRPWTPLLMALSANSPIVDGRDTGYVSWRGVVVDSWPTAGPVEPFVDRAGYRDSLNALLASGAAFDAHLLCLDARVAEDYPTVEIRVADVCTDVDDAVLVAELVRALVDTVLDLPVRDWRTDLLRAARWRARRDGVRGLLLDPTTGTFDDAPVALGHLVDTLAPALDRAGSLSLVTDRLTHLLDHGTGAERQRSVAASGGLAAVVEDVVTRTRQAW